MATAPPLRLFSSPPSCSSSPPLRRIISNYRTRQADPSWWRRGCFFLYIIT